MSSSSILCRHSAGLCRAVLRSAAALTSGSCDRLFTSTASVHVPRDESSPPATSDRGPRRQRSKEQDKDDAIGSEPWTYHLTEIPPDTTAALLSDATKEKMYELNRGNPATWTPATLAKMYNIREQRAHAILFLKEMERKAEKEQGGPLDDELQKLKEDTFGVVDRAVMEQHIKIFPSDDVDAISDPEERAAKLIEESAQEEVFLVEEFVRRLEFNKLQVSGKVKVNRLVRKRPEEGWSYVVEELGKEGRRGKRGGWRCVVGPDGTRRGLNEIEKQFLEREKTKPRRRITP